MNLGLRNYEIDSYWEEKLTELANKYEDLSIIYLYGKNMLKLADVEILITSRFSLEDLKNANKLKILIIPFTGINSLPIEELKKKNIILVNTHAHASIVSERAFTLGLSLLGRVVELDNQLRKGFWIGYNQDSNWLSIRGLRCGIVGMGEIGLNLINYLSPFNNKIITLERYKYKLQNSSNIEFLDNISEVCKNSDIIFLSLPLTKETFNIIDKEILFKMQGKYLVNVGRGELIKEEDLYLALKKNILKGAALDVWYQYPQKNEKINFPSKYPFQELSNLLLSPHCSGNEINSKINVINDIVYNLNNYLSGKDLNNIVNFDKEY